MDFVFVNRSIFFLCFVKMPIFSRGSVLNSAVLMTELIWYSLDWSVHIDFRPVNIKATKQLFKFYWNQMSCACLSFL